MKKWLYKRGSLSLGEQFTGFFLTISVQLKSGLITGMAFGGSDLLRGGTSVVISLMFIIIIIIM